jgi:predicted membrane-bound spermidine synthase
VTVIDWDSRLVYLFQGDYSTWNSQSLHDPRVTVEIVDILKLQGDKREYDIILVDLLDPDSMNKKTMAFWNEVFELTRNWTHSQSVITFNAGGFLPWNTETLQCFTRELRYEWEGSKNFELIAYHVFVPSFTTEWCFFMIRPCDSQMNRSLLNPKMLRYFDDAAWTLATLWTKEHKGHLPTKPVNLSNWTTLL